MTEARFLDAVASFLADVAELEPAPGSVGVAEPAAAQALPALVLALEALERARVGLGGTGALITEGALAVTTRVDLAAPELPTDPSFALLSPDRRTLTLHHGGLVRADGSTGPLGQDDLAITVAEDPRTVVEDDPGADEVAADPLAGVLTFGAALPSAGEVVADYFLGQWERRVVRLRGVLRIDVRDADSATVQELSDATIGALLAEGDAPPFAGLGTIRLLEMDAVGPRETELANSRRRRLRFAFEYEDVIDRPDSSGGVIRRIPLTTRLPTAAGGVVVVQ